MTNRSEPDGALAAFVAERHRRYRAQASYRVRLDRENRDIVPLYVRVAREYQSKTDGLLVMMRRQQMQDAARPRKEWTNV